ncbi:MAG: UDP-3-O-(3-hydroxymyristoyl)glucosamine N-acyltransferase [Burkholderiaceae bacterium]
MPVLLAPEQAPVLSELIAGANRVGLDYEIVVRAPLNDPVIRGLGSLTSATGDEISFLSNPKLAHQLATTRATAVVLTPQAYEQLDPSAVAWQPVLCSQPYLLYALLAQWFDAHRLAHLPGGIHPSAVIHPDARLGNGVSVGPGCVIEAGAVVGNGTRLGPACIIGAGSFLGNDCLLHARVTLYHGVRVGDRAIIHSGAVLGADGFGFAPDPFRKEGGWAKIAQLGAVVVHDDVEIGANTTIDRGALDNTVIGHGVKLDNQIMIAHNVVVGDHTAMAACVGVAGSTVIGKRCTIGGAAMLSGHLVLADDVHVSGGTAVTSSVGQPGRYTGVYPYAEHVQWQRNAAVIPQLAQLRRRLRTLEKPHN